MYEAKLHKIMEAYEHMGEYPCEIHETIRVKNIEWDEDDIEECPELEDATSEDVDITYTAKYEGDHSERWGKIDNELADMHDGYLPLDYDTEILNVETLDVDGDGMEANESHRNPFMYPKSYECDVTLTDIMWSDKDLEKHPELADITDDAFGIKYTMTNEEDGDESIGAAIYAELSKKYYGCIPEYYEYELSDTRPADDYNESVENPQHGNGFMVVVEGLGLYFTDASMGSCRFSSNINDAYIFDSEEEAENMVDSFKSLNLEVQPA